MQNVSEHGIYPVSVPWVPVVFACQFGLGKDGEEEVLTSWCSVQLDQILVFFFIQVHLHVQLFTLKTI